MKIIREYPFWVWLVRFAYRKINTPTERLPVGIPGHRDPDGICPMYAPRKRRPGDAPAECETDGHYLCKECCFKQINQTKKE